jgi:hypothetical protein
VSQGGGGWHPQPRKQLLANQPVHAGPVRTVTASFVLTANTPCNASATAKIKANQEAFLKSQPGVQSATANVTCTQFQARRRSLLAIRSANIVNASCTGPSAEVWWAGLRGASTAGKRTQNMSSLHALWMLNAQSYTCTPGPNRNIRQQRRVCSPQRPAAVLLQGHERVLPQRVGAGGLPVGEPGHLRRKFLPQKRCLHAVRQRGQRHGRAVCHMWWVAVVGQGRVVRAASCSHPRPEAPGLLRSKQCRPSLHLQSARVQAWITTRQRTSAVRVGGCD